jgi:hypothetical protein
VQARFAEPQPRIVGRLGPGEFDGEAEKVAIMSDGGADIADAEDGGEAVDMM